LSGINASIVTLSEELGDVVDELRELREGISKIRFQISKMGGMGNMNKPKRVQRRRSKGWRMPENTIDVTRPGPRGNPFVVGKHGDRKRCVALFAFLCRGWMNIGADHECILAQKNFLQTFEREKAKIRGKDVACWCRAGEICHGDIWLRVANE
jgi:hypothetical protein